ncbi:MAG: YicC family protein [Oscillospiraceae bacterium]|nr:YicC family protein [Oscillospiraceae bacterium]
MIKSMTGYGGAKGTSDKLEISIEVKSVNNRYLDCSIKLPRVYSSFEDTLKKKVQEVISRGKVDVFITIDSSNADDIEIKVNRPLVEAYVNAMRTIAQEHELNSDIRVADLTRFADILQAEKREVDADKLKTDICNILCSALSEFNEMREREGNKLSSDISDRLDSIEKLTKQAEELTPKTVDEYRKKLELRMNEVLQSTTIEEARILTEAALFADRITISEETVRLFSHISQLREMLKSNEPVGRKIDFLVQEFNREANTIGSKGNDSEIAKITVELKAEIEKIREQAQNIE